MNAGGVSKACKSNGSSCDYINCWISGKRERNTLVTCPEDVNNSAKAELIHDTIAMAQAVARKAARRFGRDLWSIS